MASILLDFGTPTAAPSEDVGKARSAAGAADDREDRLHAAPEAGPSDDLPDEYRRAIQNDASADARPVGLPYPTDYSAGSARSMAAGILATDISERAT
jgi:hypothetical protein